MFIYKTIICTIIVISSVQLTLSLRYERVEGIFRHAVPEKFELTMSQNNLGNNIVYAECSELPRGRRVWPCSIHRIPKNYANPGIESIGQTCNVTFVATQRRTIIKHWLKVYELSSNKILLVWLEVVIRRRWFNFLWGGKLKYWKKFTIISMDECTTSQASIQLYSSRIRRDDLFFPNDILLYNDDTFDVVYENPRICWHKYCRVTFDADGNKLGGPVGWLPLYPAINSIVTVEPYSPSKGYMVFRRDGSLRLLNNGVSTKLKKFSHLKRSKVLWSNEFDVISICLYNFPMEVLNCTQYDQTGRTKFVTNLKTKSDFYPIGIHNLQGGGFVLVNTYCPLDQYCAEPIFYFRSITKNGLVRNEIRINSISSGIPSIYGMLQSNIIIDQGTKCFAVTSIIRYKVYGPPSDVKFEIHYSCYGKLDFFY